MMHDAFSVPFRMRVGVGAVELLVYWQREHLPKTETYDNNAAVAPSIYILYQRET